MPLVLQTFMGGSLIKLQPSGLQCGAYVISRRRLPDQQTISSLRQNASGDMVPLSTLTTQRVTQGRIHAQTCSTESNSRRALGYSPLRSWLPEDVTRKTMPGKWLRLLRQSCRNQRRQRRFAMIILEWSLFVSFSSWPRTSWTLPFSVLLGLPIAVFGAFLTLYLRRFDNNVYAQIGLVMLIGLSSKNAILIVEFAKVEYDKGKSLIDATLTGARVRLRPILMTAFAFILGCVPLWRAFGAGAISRQVLGTTVIGGMLASTIIAIFFVPVSFYVVERFGNFFRK